MENIRLLCTFTKKNYLYKNLYDIQHKCSLVNSKVYVLENKKDPTEVMLTYNVYDFDMSLDNTVFVHRKKETNTIYSLNAMNEIIKDINGGEFDESIIVPWEEYKNMLLIMNKNNGSVRKIYTDLFTVMYL